jgi:hypothetical protein
MPNKTIDPRRLDEVEKRYLNARPTRDIERDLATEWGITRRQVRTYIAIVRRRLAAAFVETTPDEQRARVEALLLNAYRCAEAGSPVHGSDARGMVAAAKTLADLTGAMAPKKVEHSGSIGMTDPKALHDRAAAIVAHAAGGDDAPPAGAPEPQRPG